MKFGAGEIKGDILEEHFPQPHNAGSLTFCYATPGRQVGPRDLAANFLSRLHPESVTSFGEMIEIFKKVKELQGSAPRK